MEITKPHISPTTIITKLPKLELTKLIGFEKAVNNSYKINDAKFMLLREKICKNLV